MTTEATAGSAGAGNPANAGAAAGTGQAAADQGQQQTWYSGIQSEEHRNWLATKNYPNIDAAIASAHSLERLMGSEQRLVIPKDPTDKANWDKVYNTLGRPESADKYAWQAPDGYQVNKDLVDGFAKIAHESGATQGQFKAFVDWYVGAEQQANAAFAAQSETELTALRTEWGASFDQRAETGRRAVREFGLDEASLSAIESTLGTSKTLKLFSDIGARLGEHSIEGQGGSSGFKLSPAAAQGEISRLMGDATFQARYQNDDPKIRASAIEEMSRLHKLRDGQG